MSGLNRVMLLGNVGQEPELKSVGQTSVLALRLATSETWLDKQGTKQEKTEWHSVSIWDKRGEALAKIITKGDRVFIEGRIETREYEKNGEKRYATNIRATDVVFCGSKPSSERAAKRVVQDAFGDDDLPM